VVDREPVRSATSGVSPLVDDLFRRESGHLVASLSRRFGVARLDVIEDAVQDALVQALRRWPFSGVPDDPAAWLRRVALNRTLDLLRTEHRRGQWVTTEPIDAPAPAVAAGASHSPDAGDDALGDDDLRLLLACAHPSLSADVAVTVMLKTVGGLSVDEIARALLAEPTAVAQRLVRARRTLAEADEPLAIPQDAAAAVPRVQLVMQALYLMFTEGHAAAQGDAVVRFELCAEALRLARRLALHPVLGTPELDALTALFAFQGSRLDARADDAGIPVLLDAQDRSRWSGALIALGAHHLERAMRATQLSRWHLEAEIAAAHVMRPVESAPDWRRIVMLYDRLMQLAPTPVVAINRAIALGFVHGAAAAREALDTLRDDDRLARYPWYYAAQAHFALAAGDVREARERYDAALALTLSPPQRQWLLDRRSQCGESG
jgi:RNA polymerase sigma-70 factor (ECF subfamily)